MAIVQRVVTADCHIAICVLKHTMSFQLLAIIPETFISRSIRVQ